MWSDLLDLTGRPALITGGTSGIGLGIARALARAGAPVALIGRDAAKARAAADGLMGEGLAARGYAADVSQEDEAAAVVKAVEADLGPCEVLVNSAGINVRKPALDFSLAEWQGIMEINLTGTFLMCREAGRGMVERGRGSIINISSVVSMVGRPGLSAYSASKGGVSQLTRTLAMEWAPFGVRVNAIGPGFVRTPLTEPLFEDAAFGKEIKRLVPLGRGGEPEDLAGMALVLASRAGAYITGQTIYIDGGWSIS